MEELLNKLIEKGWKVFGVEPNGRKVILTKRVDGRIHISYFDGTIGRTGGRDFSLRELTSKESGLWQFVCENGMVKEGNVKNFVWTRYEHTGFEPQYPLVHKWNSAEYRLIESSLKDESELEDFLLSNIKL